MSIKRIILVVTQLEFGGAQSAAIKLCDQFNKRGINAQVVFLYKKSKAFQGQHHLYDCIFPKAPSNFLDYIKILRDFYLLVKRTRPTCVISFTHYANALVQPINWIVGIKIRIASQRNPSYSFPRGARWLDYLWGSLGIYTNNVMVSNAVFSTFSKYPLKYRTRSLVIPNGVLKRPVDESRANLRDKFGLPEDLFCMLTVGRLATQKNQEFLIDIVNEIDKGVLIIVGDGPLKETLRLKAKEVEGKVIFIGRLNENEIPEILSCSDLFVFPSLFEGMSNALIEALMYEIPIIASNIEPNKEVLGSEFNEVLLDPKDQIGWRKSIERVMNDKILRQKLVKLAKLRSEEFRLEFVTDSFENLIRE